MFAGIMMEHPRLLDLWLALQPSSLLLTSKPGDPLIMSQTKF
jgi:hypothetical protein